MKKFLVAMNRAFTAWVWSNAANDLSVVLFVLSAFISCWKSLWELFYPCCVETLQCNVSTYVNIVIVVFFIVSMGLAFLIDNVKESK